MAQQVFDMDDALAVHGRGDDDDVALQQVAQGHLGGGPAVPLPDDLG